MRPIKLSVNNILHVTVIKRNGIPYSWHVAMKSYKVSDSRHYQIYEQGKSTCKEYKPEWLPKSVQNFIEQRTPEETSNRDVKAFGELANFAHYIYR